MLKSSPLTKKPLLATVARSAVTAACLVAAGCSTSDPPSAPDETTHPWLGEVAARIPVYDYDLDPIDRRTERVELVPDLTIGERPGTDGYSFGEAAPTIALHDDGRIFVYDADNYRIKVFGIDGEHLYEFGSQGEGPGEFSSDARGRIGFTKGFLFAFFSYRRLGLWTPDGDFVDGSTRLIREERLVPLHDGAFLSADFLRGGTLQPVAGEAVERPSVVVARYRMAEDGLTEEQRYALVPVGLQPQFAGRHDGQVYVSSANESVTEVVAFSPTAEPRWRARFRSPQDQLVMPSDLMIDGRGRIYVFPRVNRAELPTVPLDRAIDVLSPDGEHLTSALISDLRAELAWQQTRDDYVFGVAENATTFEWEIVRYRLQLPFEETAR